MLMKSTRHRLAASGQLLLQALLLLWQVDKQAACCMLHAACTRAVHDTKAQQTSAEAERLNSLKPEQLQRVLADKGHCAQPTSVQGGGIVANLGHH